MPAQMSELVDNEATPSSYPFGVLLRRIREDAKLSQQALQTKLERLGYPIDTTTLSKYEAGIRKPPAEFIAYYAKAIELSSADEEAVFFAYVEDYRLFAREEYLKARKKLIDKVGDHDRSIRGNPGVCESVGEKEGGSV